jgi:hypothetical protein
MQRRDLGFYDVPSLSWELLHGPTEAFLESCRNLVGANDILK